jgi:hypothetical protein
MGVGSGAIVCVCCEQGIGERVRVCVCVCVNRGIWQLDIGTGNWLDCGGSGWRLRLLWRC